MDLKIISKKVMKVLKEFDYLGDIRKEKIQDSEKHHLLFFGKGIKVDFFIKDEDVDEYIDSFIVVYFCQEFCPWSAAEIAISFERALLDIPINFGQI